MFREAEAKDKFYMGMKNKLEHRDHLQIQTIIRTQSFRIGMNLSSVFPF